MGAKCSSCHTCQEENINEINHTDNGPRATNPNISIFDTEKRIIQTPIQDAESVVQQNQKNRVLSRPRQDQESKASLTPKKRPYQNVNNGPSLDLNSQKNKMNLKFDVHDQDNKSHRSHLGSNMLNSRSKASKLSKVSRASKMSRMEYFSDCGNSQLDFNDNTASMEQEKRPPFTYSNGSVYDGNWRGSSRHGFGIQWWPDGAKYEGYWANNAANGKGRFFHSDGDVYEGEWLNNQAHGYGVYIRANGSRYEGQWKEDLQHGFGIEKWAEGSLYEGFYQMGKKHGRGKYVWPDNSKYEGDWKENNIEGNVNFNLHNREFTNGMTEENMRGHGSITACMGLAFISGLMGGSMWDSMKTTRKFKGSGIYTWKDGRKYDGLWHDGKQHGIGKYHLQNGSFKQGLWEKGKRIKWIEDETYAKPTSDQLQNVA